MAEKLLLCKVPDLNEEIKNIELLKVRFGEAKMIRSAIIQRDIDDSARFNVNYKEMLSHSRRFSSHLGLTPLNASINVVSTGYWPINYDTSHFAYPTSFQQVFNEIDEQFRKHKPIMMLEHHNNLGSVELELKFKNGKANKFTCEPVQAILISFFDKHNNPKEQSITLEDLALKLEAHQNYVKSKLFFWVTKGVLVECKRNLPVAGTLVKSVSLNQQMINRIDMQEDSIAYQLVEDYQESKSFDDNDPFEDLENELISREKINNKDMLDNLKSYEPKIMAILGLNGPKKIEKLKCLLETVYKPEGANLINTQELVDILNAMIKLKKISMENEVYSLCMNV